MPTNSPLQPPFSCFLTMIKGGVCDGFLWPNEFGKAPFSAREAIYQAYRMPMGTLYLKKGAFKEYGYKLESDFGSDCKGGKLHAKTIRGALTLGAARYHPEENTNTISVFPPDCGAGFVFLAAGEQETMKMEQILKRYFKDSNIVVTRSDMAAFFAGAPSLQTIYRGLATIKTEAKWVFLFQAILILAALALLVAGWHKPSPYLYSGAIGIAGLFISTIPVNTRTIAAIIHSNKPSKKNRRNSGRRTKTA